MQVVISALHFAWEDIHDCLNVASSGLGLDGVELSWNESFKRPGWTREDIEELASIAGKHSTLLSAHVWDNLAESEPIKARDDLLLQCVLM